MNETERLPQITQLFEQARETIEPNGFEQNVTQGAQQLKRRRMRERIAIGLVLLLLALPLNYAIPWLTQWMVMPLIPLEGGLVSQLAAPLNSVGAAVTAALLLLRWFHQRLFA